MVFVSAAGPGGAWLSRSLTKKGQGGWVVAPSLLPKKPGERGTTTRRDAIPLARLRRSGNRTPGYVPQGEAAAMRDLGRARADAIHALQAATLRLKAFRLRQDIRPGQVWDEFAIGTAASMPVAGAARCRGLEPG